MNVAHDFEGNLQTNDETVKTRVKPIHVIREWEEVVERMQQGFKVTLTSINGRCHVPIFKPMMKPSKVEGKSSRMLGDIETARMMEA